MRVALTIALLGLLVVAGCAKTSVIPLSANSVQVLVDAPSECGPTETQELALQLAAATTIRRGFDRFVVVGADRDSQISSITYSSTTANTFGNTTYYTKGLSGVSHQHQSILTIVMFRDSDSGADEGIRAREVLGPEWQEIVADESSMVACEDWYRELL